MPRQLKILKGLAQEEPNITREKIDVLLGDAVTTAEEALSKLSTCFYLILDKDRANAADQSIFDLGVRFWNNTKAVYLLTNEGLILNAVMVQRDCIEIMIVAEYLHKNPE